MTKQTQQAPKAFVDFSEALSNVSKQHPEISIVAMAAQEGGMSRFIHTKNGAMEAVYILMESMALLFDEFNKGDTNQTVLTCILALLQNAKPDEGTMEAKAVKELLSFITTNDTISSLVKEYRSNTAGANDENT